jgi:tetratricopeptide (TPR) repeat protein
MPDRVKSSLPLVCGLTASILMSIFVLPQNGAGFLWRAKQTGSPEKKKPAARLSLDLKGATRKGWQALLKNDYASASRAFEKALKRQADDVFALDGMGLIAFEQGKALEAQQFWMRALEASVFDPLGEVFARRLHYYSSALPDKASLIECYQYLWNTGKLPGMTRALIGEVLLEFLRQSLQLEHAESLFKELGYITMWQWVVGPFGEFGSTDIDHQFGPEISPDAEQFTNRGRLLRKQAVPSNGVSPDLDFDSLIYPSHGTAYAMASFSIPVLSHPYLLRIVSNDALKIWHDGKLVFSHHPYREYYANEFFIDFHPHAGTNCILVKVTRANDPWTLTLQLIDPEGSEVHIEPAVVEEGHLPPLTSHAMPTMCNTSVNEPALASVKSEFLREFYRFFLAQAVHDYQDAEVQMAELVDEHPQSSMLRNYLGFARLFHCEVKPESVLRLRNQAREVFEAALADTPDSVRAMQGMGLFYLFQNRLDEARKQFEQARSLAPSSVAPCYFLAKVGQLKGWDKETLHFLSEAAQLDPLNQSVLKDMAVYFEREGNTQEALEKLKPLLESGWVTPSIRQKAADLAYGMYDFPTAERLYRDALAIRPSDTNTLCWLGALYMQWGRDAAAREMFLRAADISSSNPLSYDALAQLALQEGHTTEALGFYRTALRANPNNETTREKIRFAEHAMPFYAPYDVDYSAVDHSPYTSQQYPRASAAWLVDVMVLDVHPDGSYSTMVHQAVKVLTKEGRSHWDELALPAARTELLWVRAILPDGTIFEPVSIQTAEEQYLISMYGLTDNTIIDYAYVTHSGGSAVPWLNTISQLFIFQQIDNPVALTRLVCIVPEERPLNFRTWPRTFAPEISQQPDGRTVYVWEKRKLDGITHEVYQPSVDELAPVVYYSTYRDWRDFSEPVLGSFYGLQEYDDSMVKAVREVTQHAQTDREKLDCIYQYVNETIKQGMAGGTALDTYYLKTGYADEKEVLASVILALAGIPNQIAFYEEPLDIPVLVDFPHPNRFSQQAVYIPQLDGAPWCFRFGSRFTPLQNLFDTLEARPLLVLDRGHAYFVQMGRRSSEESWETSHTHYEIQDDGSARMDGMIAFHGVQSEELRRMYDDPNKRKMLLDQTILLMFKDVVELNVEAEETKQLDAPFTIRFSCTDPQVLVSEGTDYAFQPFAYPTDLSEFVVLEKRETPLKIKGSIKAWDDDVTFVLPSTLYFAHVPEDYLVYTRFGFYSITYGESDGAMAVRRVAEVKNLEVEPDVYSDFIRFCRNADEQEARKIVVRRIPVVQRPTGSTGSAAVDASVQKPELDSEQEKAR